MVKTSELEWKPLRDKVMTKPLARDEGRGFQINMIRLEPNTSYEEHKHPDVEWVYVLKGSMTDERGTFGQGEFVVNEKGSRHTVSTGPDGCELLVCWCGKVEKTG